jgi:fructokinase
MDRIALGIDLGGTKTEAVVARFDSRGDVEARPSEELARLRVPTERERGYDAVLAGTVDLARRTAALAGVNVADVPFGIGMPGAVTRREGLIKNSNTVCLNGRPFREDLAKALGKPIAFGNDANCFALAETIRGAGAPYKEGIVFGVIMGTGVGGGLVVSGAVWPGVQSLGGEWGHHAVWAGRSDARSCYCGQRGCLEQYASGPAVEGDYARRAGVARSVSEIVERRASDPHAAAAIESLLDSFGRGLANLIDMIDPSAVVLGGGLSNLALLALEGPRHVARYVFNDELITPIVKNTLGDSAGVLGAALVGRATAESLQART